jgi:dolichyl-phosphate beta-glucosyltransferase
MLDVGCWTLDVAPKASSMFPCAPAMPPESVSIVIPAYNESRRLPPTLEELMRWTAGREWPVEVLIVVEPSTDGTREIAAEAASRQPNFRMLTYEQQRGKGFAVRTGVLAATGALVFYMDCDLSVPLAEVDAFVRYFGEHPEVDVLFGNRQHAQSRITVRQSWLRQRMGQTFNAILRRLTLAGVSDTQCGFKAFRLEAARAIFERQHLDGFAFDVEVLLLAQKLGLHVADLPVEWRNSPESKVRLVHDSFQMLRDTFRIRRELNG